MEELNQNQKQDLLRKRQELLKNMGVKNAGQMNESVVSVNNANSSIAAKFEAIRNGSKRQDFSQFINATGKNAPAGASEFQGIPETKKRKDTNQTKQEVKPEYKQDVANFDVTPIANGGELSAIESLFGGEAPRGSMGNSNTTYSAHSEPSLNIDSMPFPTFNPLAVMQKKAREQGQDTTSNQYIKNDEFVDSGNNSNQSNINLAMMQSMMEQIAKGVAEKTIKTVLNDYSQQQKGKVFFEYYNKEKGIIKTADGKYFRLTQVELKKK